MLISRPFRVALEGQTTDGRKIQRDWIDQMAANYDPAKYGARIWMEHLRSLLPDGPFSALGDVVGIEARDVEVDGKPHRALYATISPTPELVSINQRRQKVYTSIEVDPNFGGSGQAYLVGLGVTDTPASLGTEMLRFAAEHPAVLAHRKSGADNLIGEALETELSFEEEASASKPSLLERLKALFSSQADRSDTLEEGLMRIAEEVATLKAAYAERHEHLAAIDEIQALFSERLDELAGKIDTDLDALRRQFADLQASLELAPADPHQDLPPATGGRSELRTDC